MGIAEVRKNDFLSIEKSVINYLEKKINLLVMIGSIDMFANSTFDNKETKEFYNFLMNSMCEIEMLYFMKGEEYTHHEEVVELVIEFQKKLNKYAHIIKEQE